jgi:hypothetical protein
MEFILVLCSSSAIAALLFATAWLRRRTAGGSVRRVSVWLPLVAAIAIVLLGVAILSIVPARVSVEGLLPGPRAEDQGSHGVVRGLGLFVLTIAGMGAKTLWDAIDARRAPRRRLNIDPWQFAKPMLVSPIVFLVVWKNSAQAMDLSTLCLAFQNGFTWQTLLGKTLVAGNPPPGKAAAAR